MTREEIEQIIRENIRTNGRGEITARVMAGVLESFVNYTDTQAEDFAELCRQLAAAFNALVQEMEGRFETKADALEAAMEAFCSDLLNNHFIPWAEGLAGSLSDKMDLTKEAADAAKAAALEAKAASLEGKAAADQAGAKADEAKTAALDAKAGANVASEKSTAAKAAIDSAADGIAEALLIIREGNKDDDIIKDGRTVVFFDYDGTVLYAYTPAELLAMEELPAAPEHDGLTAQGWNWTLAAAKAYVNKYPGAGLNIGMIYKPTDGKLHLSLVVSANLNTGLRVSGVVDWGDGTVETLPAGYHVHTYAQAGAYEVTVEGITSIEDEIFYGHNEFVAVAIPEGVTSIGARAFSDCRSLRTVVIPEGVTTIGVQAFNYTLLKSVAIPKSCTNIGGNTFYQCSSLVSVCLPGVPIVLGNFAFLGCGGLQFLTIPDGVTGIGDAAFEQAFGLARVYVPDTVTSIGNEAFFDTRAAVVVAASTPPVLGSQVFLQGNNPVRIFVPDAAVEDYKAATNWSAFADIIFPISQIF